MNNDFKEDFRGNKQLKAPNVKEYITTDIFKYRINEFQKIHDDITYFAEKYFYIISLDAGKSLIKLYPKQAELVKKKEEKRRVITLACRQCGKCVRSKYLYKNT